VIGVLVLIDQHVSESAPVVLGNIGEQLQHRHRTHDEVVEVHRIGPA